MNIKYWNIDVDFTKMHRLDRDEVEALKPGDEVYYVNMNDELTGVIYNVIIKERRNYNFVLDCMPVIETIPDDPIVPNNVTGHVECFSVLECYQDTNQMLFKNIVFKES